MLSRMQSVTLKRDEELKDGLSKLLKTIGITPNRQKVYEEFSRSDSNMGEIACICVEGKNQNGEPVKLNLIAKVKPEPSQPINQTVKFKYQREVYIYEKVLASFCKLQEEHQIKDVFQAYPKYYYSLDENIIYLDNMTELGFEVCAKEQVFNYNQISLVLKELGKLHALSFVLRQENEELFNEFYQNTHGFTLDNTACDSIGKKWFDYALSLLDKKSYAYTQFLKLEDKVFELSNNFETSSQDKKYAVIGHCNCLVSNILFKYENDTTDGCPSEVCLLDWQTSARCSPAVDISQVLYCCCDKGLRKRHYEDFIKAYYTSFSTYFQQFGYKAEELFPYQVLQDHLKMFSVIGLCTAIVTLSATANQVITSTKTTNKLIDQRLKEVILDHIQYGLDI